MATRFSNWMAGRCSTCWGRDSPAPGDLRRPVDPASAPCGLAPLPGRMPARLWSANIVGIDPHQHAMLVGDDVSRGDVLMFCVRDNEAAEADLRRMLQSLKARVSRASGRALLQLPCPRAPHVRRRQSGRWRSSRTSWAMCRWPGFFSNGEISLDRLYAYTGVLTLFRDD